MKTKDPWIDKAMESLDDTDRALLDPLIREMILHRIQSPVHRQQTLNSGLVWKKAAMILLLISFNIFTIVHFKVPTRAVQDIENSVASEYFSYIDIYTF